MSESNKVTLKYIVENAPDVISATVGNPWHFIPFTSCSLAHLPQYILSNEIGDNKQQAVEMVCVGSVNGGDIGFELSNLTYKDLMLGVMEGQWIGADPYQYTDVRSGVADTFAFEIGYENFDTPHYMQFGGCRINSMTLNFAYGEVITGSFNVVAESTSDSATSIAPEDPDAGFPTELAYPRKIYDASCGESTLTIDGQDEAGVVKSLTITLNNGLRPQEGIGAAGAVDFFSARASVTGSMLVYFDDITWYQRLLENAEFSVQMKVSEGSEVGDSYFQVELPRCKLAEGSPAVSGADTDVMLNLSFVALHEDTKSSMRIIMDTL